MPAQRTRRAAQRLSAAERRRVLVDAAVIEFAHGGLHGTPVERIAKRVGVTQPYVFSLFGSKRELFIAAVEAGFARVEEIFEQAADAFDPATAEPEFDVLRAMGRAYIEMLAQERPVLMLQHQSYAACQDPVIRRRVRRAYAHLVARVEELSEADGERIDDFLRRGMWLNVAAAMGVEDLCVGSEWMQAELASTG